MPSKMNREARRAVQKTIADMVSIGGNLVAGKGSSVHTFFDTARNNKITAAVQSDAARASKPKEFNV